MKILLTIVLCLMFASVDALEIQKSELSVEEPGAYDIEAGLVRNEENGKILAIWERHPVTDSEHSIRGIRISAKGVPKGKQFTIVEGPNPFFPSAVYNPVSREFLLVYSNEIQGALKLEIYAQRLNSHGMKRGAAVRVSLQSDLILNIRNDRPKVAVDPESGHYAIFWVRSNFGTSPVSGEGLYGAILDQELNVIHPPALLHSIIKEFNAILGPYPQDVVYHPSTGKVLLSFSVFEHSGVIHYAYMALDTLSPTPLQFIQGTPVRSFSSSKFLCANESCVVYFSDGEGIKRNTIQQDANAALHNFPAFKGPLKKQKLVWPCTAFSKSGEDHGFLMGVRDFANTAGKGAIFVQRIHADGKTTGPPEEIDSGFPAASGLDAVVLPSSNDSYRFLLVYSNGQTLVEESGGITLLNVALDK